MTRQRKETYEVAIVHDKAKELIYKGYKEGYSKSVMARHYEISVRTIGRVIEEMRRKENTPKPIMIGSETFITLVMDNVIIQATPSHANFSKALEAVKAEDWRTVYTLLDTKEELRVYSKGDIRVVNDILLYKNKQIDIGITRRIVKEMHNNRPYEHLVNFFDRVMQNPSNESVIDLFEFLEHNDIQITNDGHFVAWKRVKADYTDFATGMFDNSPGAIAKMDRDKVNPDRNKTCSAGLHVAAKSYIPHYNGGRGRIISVKVDPADVVAVPVDYENAKMRVCQYVVLDDVTEKFVVGKHYD